MGQLCWVVQKVYFSKTVKFRPLLSSAQYLATSLQTDSGHGVFISVPFALLEVCKPLRGAKDYCILTVGKQSWQSLWDASR